MTRDRHQSSIPVRKFKGETVFGWEEESAQEWPNGSAELNADTRSGVHRPLSSQASLQAQRERMARRRRGSGGVWLALALVALIAAAGIVALRHFLRA